MISEHFINIVFNLLIISSFVQSVCHKNVKCLTDVKSQDDCPEGTYFREKSEDHGCCPHCMDNLKDELEICHLSAKECKPGLSCVGFLCRKDNKQICVHDKNRINSISWKISCQEDGLYAAKQCKGEREAGRCFCYSADGARIFGESTWSTADNMTCACSRYVEELKKTRTNVMIHCNEKGDFEPLQCDDNVCWCADEQTGVPHSKIVPEKMMKLLPCYHKAEVGSQYLRQCDSIAVTQANIVKLLQERGTDVIKDSVSCNLDGSFARVQFAENGKICTYLDKTKIKDFRGTFSESPNCNCAYDEYVSQMSGQSFPYQCKANGDYEPIQVLKTNGYKFCVDSDGYQVTSPVKPQDPITCN